MHFNIKSEAVRKVGPCLIIPVPVRRATTMIGLNVPDFGSETPSVS
jgi:hypothetical protein